MNLDRRLLRFIYGAISPFTWSILGGFGAGVLAILQAKLLSRVIALVFLGGRSLPEVMPVMWLLLVVITGRAVSSYIGERSGIAIARQVISQLRDLLGRKIFSLGPLYTRSVPTGEITSVYLQGIDALDAYFSQFLPQIVLAGLVPAAVLVLVFPVDWISGLVLLVTGPLIPFFMFLIGSNAEQLTRRQFGALSRMSAYLLDTLQGLKALKELGRSRDQAGRIREISEQYRETTMQVLRITFLSALALEMLGTISTAVIAVQIGLRLLYGQMGFEQAFFVLLIAPDFYLPLRVLGLRFHASMNGVSAARRIFSLLDEVEPVHTETPGELSGEFQSSSMPFPSGVKPPEIRFEQVSFQYAGRGEPAVQDLTFSAKPGELTALVGESGAGKSTVLSLLLRLILPQSGVISCDGIPINDFPVDRWRQRITWVGQQPYFTAGTLADNLRIANKNADQDEMMHACFLAGLGNWVRSLPSGLNSQIGEGAGRLSGGQAQRLALARAFIRNAPILLMDEPTAHLDPPEEALLERAVQELCKRRTTLVIAHRLSTIMNADQILVFEKGRIVEAGTHRDLAYKQGIYSKLVSASSGDD